MSNKKNAGNRGSLLMGASVLAAAAALGGAPAFAQDANTTPAGATSDDEIVVTGTRLARQDFQAISPVTTVGAEQLELTATLTTDSLLNELPQIIPGNTRTSNNSGGFAFATVDLRGLGPQRTLVLVNGERVPVSSTLGAVDINTIPASLISRIEVVTGGASAVYGSDAMAGVVNFVLKDDYEGGEVNMTYGSELSTGNGQEFEINGLVGGNFANGRGNLTAYASYFDRNKVSQREYDYSRVSGAICYDASRGSQAYFICDSRADAAGHPVTLSGGSGTPPWGWITNNPANAFKNLSTLLPGTFGAGNTDTNCDGVAGGAVNTGNLSFNNAGQLTPRNTAGFCAIPDRSIGSSRYNFAPDNYLIIPAERIALNTSGHYQINDDVRLNVLMTYVNSRTEVQLAPTPATGLTVSLTPAMQTLISTNHPDLWTALQSRTNPLAPFVEDRRATEVGTRNGYFESNSFYFIASLEGSLGDNWDWSLSGSYGQVLFSSRGVNSVNATALRQGLAGCQTAGGAPLGNAALPGCVPLDIFGPGTLTPAMTSFLRVNTFSNTVVEENRVSGFVRGDLFTLPAGAVSSVFGFEYRDDYAELAVDNEQRTGNIFGFNAIQDQRGSIDVYELYTEIAVPILKEVPGADYLGLELGYRRSNYSSVGDVDTYKIGGEWAPVHWLRFRAMYNMATRAPSVFELFQAGDQGFPAYVDPCRDANSDGIVDNPAVTNAFCLSQGVPPGAYPGFNQNNSQVQQFAFGNPNLSSETAETKTYGIVFQPDWFPLGDLQVTVDYYDIDIADAIAPVGAAFFLNDCYVNNTASSCGRITRDPTTGQVTSINATTANQSVLATKGYDIQLEWQVPVGPGQLTVNELYSILDSFALNGGELGGTTSAGVGGAFPDYKSVLSLTYDVGDWTLFARWTYTPELESGNGFGATLGTLTTSPAASYVDASLRWSITDNFTLTANVNNLFDEYPPQTADGFFSQANTDPQVYRVLGRSFAVSARLRF